MKVEDSHWFLLGAAWRISERLPSSNATAHAEPVTTLQINTASGSLRSTSPSKASPRQIHSRQDSSEAISADVKSVWKIYRSLSQHKEPAYRVVLMQWNLLTWMVRHLNKSCWCFFNLLPQKLNGKLIFKNVCKSKLSVTQIKSNTRI